MANIKTNEITKTWDERVAEAVMTAKVKIFAKDAVFALACITASIFCATSFKDRNLWLFPALLTLLPIGLASYYAFLMKRDMMKQRVMIITDVSKDIVRGIFIKSSIFQKKYSFFYYELEEPMSFTISRGSTINTMKKGQTYLVLFNSNRPAGADNFIEFTGLDTTADEKEELFGNLILSDKK